MLIHADNFRTYLSGLNAADTEDLKTAFLDPSIARNIGMEDYSTAAMWLLDYSAALQAWRLGCLMGIRIAAGDSQLLIGAVGIDAVDLENKSGMIGYWIVGKYRGNGYASESVRMIMHYGFTRLLLERINAEIAKSNAASIRVPSKLGFHAGAVAAASHYQTGANTVFLSMHVSNYVENAVIHIEEGR